MFTLITQVIGRAGLSGVFLLMLVENLLPFIPSELILPLAGFEAAQGRFPPAMAVLAGGLGSALGGVAWYALGRRIGGERLARFAERHGRWLGLSAAEVRKATAWFARRGALAVCLGRMLPGVRAVICIPAGVAKMPFGRFILWSSLGAFVWSGLLVAAGVMLGARYDDVDRWMNPVVDGLIIVAVALYGIRVATYRPEP